MGLYWAMDGSTWSHYLSYTLPFLLVSFRMWKERTKFMIIPSHNLALFLQSAHSAAGQFVSHPPIDRWLSYWWLADRIPESWRNARCFVNPMDIPTLLKRCGWLRKPWECYRSFGSVVGYWESSTDMSFPSYHGSVWGNLGMRGDIDINMAINRRMGCVNFGLPIQYIHLYR